MTSSVILLIGVKLTINETKYFLHEYFTFKAYKPLAAKRAQSLPFIMGF